MAKAIATSTTTPTLSARLLAYIQANPGCKRRDVLSAVRFNPEMITDGGYRKRRNTLQNLVRLGLVPTRFANPRNSA